jgi:hypothetical protein
MREISRFFGIVIKIFFDNHNLASYKTTSPRYKTGTKSPASNSVHS